MGFIGNIGKALGGIIKQVAPQILQAVAPAATALLSKITDGFVSSGANFLKTALNALPIPSPLKALAEKLLGKGADMLKQLGGGLLEKGLAKLMEMITGRDIPGIGNVNIPSLATPGRQDAIANNPAPATGSTGSAATGSSGASSTSNRPPDPKAFGDLKDNNNMQALLDARQAYQDARQTMLDSAKFMSDILKAGQETLKAIAQNVR